MLQALSDEVVQKLRDQDQIRGIREGKSQDGWILIDYGNIVLHLLSPDRRKYYRLEELWGQGKVLLHLQ